MNERQRQDYLQAFGIESYVPRWVLPGAAESEECDLGPLPEETLASEREEQKRPAPASAGPLPVASAAAGLVDEDKSNVARERKPREAQEAARPHRFLLSAWRVGEGLMILDSRQTGQALPVEQLLLNICRALGYRLSALPAPEILRWPLSRSAGSQPADPARGVQDARAMVEAYLSARHEKQPISALLLMGADAARHGLAEAEVEPLAGEGMRAAMPALMGRRFRPGFAAGESNGPVPEAIVLPSLTALLKRTSLKKPTWKAIQHLRASG